MAQDEPTPEERAELEELARRMQAELRNLTAAELLSQTGVTLVNLAAARLGLVDGQPDDDPAEARAAIDALGALLPVLEAQAPGPLVGDLRAGLAQLRMAYVSIAEGGGGGPSGEGGGGGGEQAPPDRPQEPPAQPRPRIWTPGGDV
jgi:hypothetical protein